jgi:hypothetical protein
MRKRAHRTETTPSPPWTRSWPGAQRAAAVGITTPGDPAERRAADAAASLAPLGMPQDAHDESRAQTDTIAAQLAPGSAGQPLSSAVREPLERRLGHQFGHVRIHADVTAESSARGLRARAYTIGRHVMFDAGRYAPDTPDGRRLLAHELTHVAQADAGAAPMISRDDATADPKKIVAGRTTGKLESDVDDLGTVLDALIAASQVLAPYIDKSKLRTIKGSIAIVGPEEFSIKFHAEDGHTTPMTGNAKDPDIKEIGGLTQKNAPHNILLREKRSNFGDALHEAIHRVSLPAFISLGTPANEGAPEYFTRKILAEARLSPPKNKYDRHVKSIEQLIDLVGEPLVGAAFFNASKLNDLGNAVGTDLRLRWIKAMIKEDFDTADALIVREKVARQLRQQIHEAKHAGSGAAAP